MNYQEKIQSGERCNTVLANYVALYMLTHLELRYILWATKIVNNEDRFYEEPYNTIVRILQTILESLQLSESDNREDDQRIANNRTKINRLNMSRWPNGQAQVSKTCLCGFDSFPAC